MTMPPGNLFVPARYAETIVRLGIGVELIDALSTSPGYPGERFPRPVTVLDEKRPAPLHTWRRWPPGLTLDDALTALTRHRSGRFARLGRDVDDLTVRVVEPPGPAGRALVPRRLRLRLHHDPVPADPPDPLYRRIFRVHLFPGAAGGPGPGATVIRGRVTRPDADGIAQPVRWVRAVARDEDGDDLGWAHGDDRGEFTLIVTGPDGVLTMPPDLLPVLVTVTVPPDGVPPPGDPLVPQVDPIWDLPVETTFADADPLTDPVRTGRSLWDGPESGPFVAELALGRETFLPIAITP
ncbi:hypothetical protein [Actinoplanes sp. M2I2]|uniref:hypothetical protein n=1 Tax=Actinoplanes sp. M2I2 TaxID=1734444 RepID=UPI0020210122|nr:hypothetical protein [Actinoplanes sp. M2I2]